MARAIPQPLDGLRCASQRVFYCVLTCMTVTLEPYPKFQGAIRRTKLVLVLKHRCRKFCQRRGFRFCLYMYSNNITDHAVGTPEPTHRHRLTYTRALTLCNFPMPVRATPTAISVRDLEVWGPRGAHRACAAPAQDMHMRTSHSVCPCLCPHAHIRLQHMAHGHMGIRP